jgi:outer membrane lipoprotein SlyB
MKSILAIGAIALALAAPFTAEAIGKNEKGCLAGGAIGGIGGAVLGNGNHALLGAVAGCAVGTVVADDRKHKESRAQANERQRRERREARDSNRDDHPAPQRAYQ